MARRSPAVRSGLTTGARAAAEDHHAHPAPGPPLRPPHPHPPPRLRRGGHRHPRARHRPQRRGLHRGGRGPGAQRARTPSRSDWCTSGRSRTTPSGGSSRSPGRPSASSRPRQPVRLRRRLLHVAPIAWTGRPDPEELPALNVSAQLPRRPRGPPCPRPRLPPRRGRGRRPARGRPHRRLLEDAAGRRPPSARHDAEPRRRAHHGRGRASSGLPLRARRGGTPARRGPAAGRPRHPPEPELDPAHRPAPRRRHGPAGEEAAGRVRGRAPRALPRRDRRRGERRGPAPGRAGRARRAGAGPPLRLREPGAPGGLRECGQPPARARGRSAEGALHPGGARRGQRAPGPSAPDRERAARRRGRSARAPRREAQPPAPARRDSVAGPGGDAVPGAARRRRPRADLQRCGGGPHHTPLRSPPGASGLAAGDPGRAQGRGTGDARVHSATGRAMSWSRWRLPSP